jgi:hypothetical protein
MTPRRAASSALIRRLARHVSKNARHDHHRPEPNVDLGNAELRVLRRDAQVAGDGQTETARQRMAVHTGNRGLAQLGHVQEQLRQAPALEIPVEL